ncbi:39 kda fk506-binding nuclear protein [Anaeramoeba flamelloides]|uniref:39 kDa fk506-binding nuclear protein n=1 Tax=Anaeramoeba flamelloides TaxID=1746091 RepID=A0AAV7YZD8_9EUKA|nr:39 kda fk506-binding nuclear protein [Anaeramoeba flamelloides]
MYGNGGLEIKQSEKYSLELNTQMNLISATLDLKAKKGERVNLYVHKNNSKILLCSLKKGVLENFRLDVPFNPFQTIRFSAEGDGDASIHIFFFNNPADDEYGMDDDDEEDFNEIIEEQVNYFKNKLKEGEQILPDSDELDSKKHELLNEMMEKEMEKEMEKKKNKKNKKVQEKETGKKNNKNQKRNKNNNNNKKQNQKQKNNQKNSQKKNQRKNQKKNQKQNKKNSKNKKNNKKN